MEIIALDTATPQLRAPPSGVSYIANRPIAMTPETLTGSAATSSLSIAQTWNTTGTPTAIDLNVTDTASNASSLLMNLRVGGASRMRVTKTGIIQNSTSNGVDLTVSYNTILRSDGGQVAAAVGNGLAVVSTGEYGWNTSGWGSNAADLRLARDAANTLAQRNGVNAQAFNIYNTYTDASNYERLSVYFSSNNAWFETQALGTGSSRSLNINASAINLRTGGTVRWGISAAGHFAANGDNTYDIGGTNGRPRNVIMSSYIETLEMTAPAAPAANGVRIFAQDNGAGKTQLMALFATGAAQQIAIEP